MAKDGPITIASAVIVPENTTKQTSKRRTLSPSVDGSKRPRLDSTAEDAANSTNNTDEVQTGDDVRTTRKRKLLGEDEVKEQERKRGQRLFGALLGTIGKFQQDSQSARAKAGANRRKEVEEKLQQKLRQQNEELDEKKRRESSFLKEKMQQEQKLFQERSLELKHANLRARANYLCTKSKPHLYYLPWKLTEDEEALIQIQLDETETVIKRERADMERRLARDDGHERIRRESAAEEQTKEDHPRSSHISSDVNRLKRDDDLDTVMGDDDPPKSRQGLVNPPNGRHENTNVSAPDHDNERRCSDVTSQDVGEVVIEAGEDTVIY